jgi:hypothetical protein
MVPYSVRFRFLLLAALMAGCKGRHTTGQTAAPGHALTDSTAISGAIDVATQRMTMHGDSGLSVDDVKRTREWFTPELYTLLMRDMSHSGEIGYLNWDPFTAAQDDVGPFRYDGVSQAGDTVMVSFSREAPDHKRYVFVRLAMRYVNGAWRIGNFIYPGNSVCHADLARGLARYAGEIATKSFNAGGCSD